MPAVQIDELRLPELGFLKIDVEGNEASVLDGASDTLRRLRPTVFIEHEISHSGSQFGDVFERLKTLDYEGFYLHATGLRHLSFFNPRHDQAIGTDKAAATYVSNFVFLPRNLRVVGLNQFDG